MKSLVLKGSKQQIAEDLARISGEVREAIVFVEEPNRASDAGGPAGEDVFAEMLPYMVDVERVDDSREGIHSRMEGE
ncbi:MAG: hypothetical protein WED34_11420 [Planctomycetales bacterium]